MIHEVAIIGYSGHAYVVANAAIEMGIDLTHYCDIKTTESNPFQLEYLDTILGNKRELALMYKKFFSEKGINFRTELSNTKSNYWLMCVELENREERDLFLKETNANNVMTRPI
ncbi:MAG: hypothetical protein RBR97_13420 [Bacteroidales bacterium]|nr:hypothetical protein [Bacteroidales bacterium]